MCIIRLPSDSNYSKMSLARTNGDQPQNTNPSLPMPLPSLFNGRGLGRDF
jgi:hypothetical protein